MCKKLKSELPFLCEDRPMRLEHIVKAKTSACLLALGELVVSKLEVVMQEGRIFATEGACCVPLMALCVSV